MSDSITRRTLIRRGGGLAVAATAGPALFPFAAQAQAPIEYSWYAYNTNEYHDGSGNPHPDMLPQMDRMKISQQDVPLYRTQMNKLVWESRGRSESTFDGLVGAAIGKGISLAPILVNISPHTDTTPTQTNPPIPYYPNLTDWRAFCQYVSRRYGPNGTYYSQRGYTGPARIRFWEIFNEPNLAHGWVEPAAYAQLLRESYLAIRQYDGSPQLLFGGLATGTLSGTNGHQYFRLVHEADSNIGSYYKHVAVHNYPSNSGTEWDAANTTLTAMQGVRNAMIEKGAGNKRMWLNEFSVERRSDPSRTPPDLRHSEYCRIMLAYLKQYRGSPLGPCAWWPFANAVSGPVRATRNGLIASAPNYSPAYNAWWMWDQAVRDDTGVGLVVT
jgi:hypothetical protein